VLRDCLPADYSTRDATALSLSLSLSISLSLSLSQLINIRMIGMARVASSCLAHGCSFRPRAITRDIVPDREGKSCRDGMRSVPVQITGDRIPRNLAAVLEGDKPGRNDSSFLSPPSGCGQRRRRPEKISRVRRGARDRAGINFYPAIAIQSIEATGHPIPARRGVI